MSGAHAKRLSISSAGGSDEDVQTAHAADNDNEHDDHSTTKAGSTPTSSNQRNIFRWADLPAELREKIYELSLARHAIALRAEVRNGKNVISLQRLEDEQRHGLTPSLLLINRATYAEGGPVLYGNHFYLHDSMALYVFLAILSPKTKDWIREMTLSQWNRDVCADVHLYRTPEKERILVPAFTSLIGMTNLQRLHLEFTLSSIDNFRIVNRRRYSMQEHLALCIYEWAHFWLDELSREKGSREEAVKIIDIRVSSAQCLTDYGLRWNFPSYEEHADLSSERTSLLRYHLVEYIEGRIPGVTD
ncbi:hypothetical protein DIS24_g8973 [Lasiodiplodia hormozganensis]|uniref:F-box domain-containing protein n=1 Tax=Lasiodiplodia hormozganensis TaxID=869390 RepID=A0AA39XYB7_9PEZI|nr:hypothetical protein DIS24_g8973 [Lasiodiplodia hormozganensis]